MTDAGQPDGSGWAILEAQVSTVHGDGNSISAHSHDTMSQRKRIVGLRELMYGFRSRHRSLIPPLVVRACRLLEQAAGPHCNCNLISLYINNMEVERTLLLG